MLLQLIEYLLWMFGIAPMLTISLDGGPVAK